jgi:hypothetical protein|tara:strand:+ start:2823 stop:3302 length:480 start_codon:yes stop_codon:yes gene_type:complete
MVYNITFSFNAKLPNITTVQNNLLNIAEEYNAHNYYFSYEENLYKKNINIMCIFNLSFENSEIKYMTICMNEIRNIKKISLDCIFEENNNYRLIYASKYYLQTIEKDSVSNYKKFHRERSYSDTDSIILKSIDNKNRSHTISGDSNNIMSYDDYLKIIS